MRIFLKYAAAEPEIKVVSSYVNFIPTAKCFTKLISMCHKKIDNGDATLATIASILLKKLNQYSSSLDTLVAKVANLGNVRVV